MPDLNSDCFKSISLLILFVYKLMIGSSKNNRENYPRKCFRIPEKETSVKFNPRLSANRPSNNWAQTVKLTYQLDRLQKSVLLQYVQKANQSKAMPSQSKSMPFFSTIHFNIRSLSANHDGLTMPLSDLQHSMLLAFPKQR